jgi:neutral ceramidase
MTGLLAGAATRDITPQNPQFLVGYPHVPRLSEGIHDPLSASSLYLCDGTNELLFIAVDILFVSAETVARCRAALSKATGVPEQNILISASHTHSGPVTNQILAWQNDPVVPPPDPGYVQKLHEGIVESGIAAYRGAQPAQMAMTTAHADGVGSNRLNPNGPFDPEIGLIAVQRQSDCQLISLVVVYGMHPTVLHEDSRLVSSDFPHFTRQHIGQKYPETIILYHLGPCGNLSPRYHVKAQTFAEAKRLGDRLGASITNAIGALKDTHFTKEQSLTARRATTELPANTFPSVPFAREKLQRARERYERLKCEGSAHGPLRTAECEVFGCEEALTLATAQMNGELTEWQKRYCRAEVQVFRIGKNFIVAWPGEQFVEYGLALKKQANHPVFIISLANGELQGYIATTEAAAAGAYEAAFAMFKPESGEHLIKTALQLIRELA